MRLLGRMRACVRTHAQAHMLTRKHAHTRGRTSTVGALFLLTLSIVPPQALSFTASIP